MVRLSQHRIAVQIAVAISCAACGPGAISALSGDASADLETAADGHSGADLQSTDTKILDMNAPPDSTERTDIVPDLADIVDAELPQSDGNLQEDSQLDTMDDVSDNQAPETETVAIDAAESTAEATAPADCPTLPPMCPTWRQIWWEQPFVPGFVPFPKTPSLDATSWSRLRPVQVKQILPHTVRIWATWRNQRNLVLDTSKVASGFGKANPEYHSGCAMLKPSLLPTGCIVLDVSTKSRVVTNFQFLPKAASTWPAIQLQMPAVIGQEPLVDCQGMPQGAALPIELTTTDGLIVRAYDGHANVEVVMADPSADPSTIVRDEAVGMASALEIGDAITTTQVPIDVSVCRATEQDIALSGCACPTEQWPAASPTPSDDHIAISSKEVNAVLTTSFLGQVEPKGWDGQGYVKKDGVSAFDAVKSTMCCSGSKCPIGAYDWECAGTAFTQFGGPAAADIYLSRTKFLFLEYTVLPYGPPGPSWLGALSAPKDSTYFHFINGLSPRIASARQRDGVLYNCKLYSKPDTFVAQLTALSGDVTSNLAARCCRLHVSPDAEMVPTFPGGPCQEISVSVGAHLTRWSPP